MRRELEGEGESSDRFHVGVMATLSMLAKAMVVDPRRGGKET